MDKNDRMKDRKESTNKKNLPVEWMSVSVVR